MDFDFTDIGIPPSPNLFSTRAESDGAGIKKNDVVLIEVREPKPGEVVAVVENEQTDFRRLEADSKFEVHGVVVGLIRKL